MLFNNVSSDSDKSTFLVQVAPPALFSGKKATYTIYSAPSSDDENSPKNSENSTGSKKEEE